MNYYNEFDHNAAEWLRELIAMGLIPPGEVDERSIADVTADDLRGFTQCHFFAGIAGWSYALQLAGWDANRPVWTGSCPCQAFSTAGKQKGFADERDLWPTFFNLIKECRPEYVFGEQVENAIKHGWLDRVYRDMEAEGYSCGSIVLGAHSIGSPHQRQRLYWGCTLADIPDTDTEQCYRSGQSGQTGRGEPANGSNEYCSKELVNNHNTRFQATSSDRNKTNAPSGGGNDSCRISYAQSQRCCEERSDSQRSPERSTGTSIDHALAENSNGGRCRGRHNGNPSGHDQEVQVPGLCGDSGVMAYPERERHEEQWRGKPISEDRTRQTQPSVELSSNTYRVADNSIIGSKAGVSRQNKREERQSGIIVNGDIQSYSSTPWERYKLIYCQDGAVRRIPAESVFFGVADGIPEGVDGSGNDGISEVDGFPLTKQKEGRPMLLKGYGNAIVPQVAAEFIKAFEASIKDFANVQPN